jgi:hypothetical protein
MCQKHSAKLGTQTDKQDDFGHPFLVDLTKTAPNLRNGSFQREKGVNLCRNNIRSVTQFLMDSDSLLHTRKKKVDPVNRTGSGLLGASVAPVQPR